MKPDVMGKSRAAGWAGVVGLSITILGCATATVQKPAHRPTMRLGVVRSLTGNASLERPPAIAVALNVKDEVVTGDRVTTDDRSEAAIILAGRAELKMLASAAVTVTGSVDQFLLTVEKGLIIYTMADTEEVQQVVTPNTALRLMGAIAFITVVTGARVQTTSVCAQRGSINAAIVGGGAVIVKENQCVSTVNDRIGPSYPLFPSPLPPTGDTGSIKPIHPGTPTAWRAMQRVPRRIR
jgi:hypothetical protein